MKTLQSPQPNSPIHLSTEEIDNPQLVLEKFHDFFQLNSVRTSLSDLLQVALSSDAPTYDSGLKRSNLLHLHHQMNRLVEATSLLAPQGDAEGN
jgi:hypothetical protein